MTAKRLLNLLLAGAMVFPATAQNANTAADSRQKPEQAQPTNDEDRALIQDSGGLPAPAFTERDPRYRLHIGDVMDLTFPFTPEFDQSVTIQPDGYITLREIGDTKAAGQSVPELRETLRRLYAPILKDPVVRVDLKDFEKPFFVAGGEVRQPGKYELRSSITVAEAVAVAGGFNDGAKHTQVLLFRRLSDEWVEVRKVNVKNLLSKASLHEDLALRPGDMIYVPKTRFASLKGLLMPKVVLGPSIRPM